MYIIIYDFGTGSVKTCLFNIDSEIHVVANAKADYGIYLSDEVSKVPPGANGVIFTPWLHGNRSP